MIVNFIYQSLFTFITREEIQRSRHTYAVYELFAELIGGLSKIRFVSVSDRFIAKLESYMKLPPHAIKEHETKIELLIKGMHYLQLKVDFFFFLIFIFFFALFFLKKKILKYLNRYIRVKR